MLRVLSLDPGDRVGWARADVDPSSGTWDDFRHGITPLKDMALAVHSALVYGDDTEDELGLRYDLVVCEDWRLYPHLAKTMVGSAFPSVQFIGMVKLSCWLSGTKYVTQGAAIKTTADKVMAKLNPELHELVTKPIAHDDGHDLDAIRHLYFWTYRNTAIGETTKEAA